MLNHRLINPPRVPEKLVRSAVKFLQKYAQNKKVFCALSGGVDSACTYLLLKKAGIEVIPVFIDHGLMRIIRGKEEREHLKQLFPEIKIVDIRETFLPRIYGEGNAEKKRKLFKNTYSETITNVIEDQNCDLLADGTILPDIEESFGVKISDLKETMSLKEEISLKEKHIDGFVKSQHNLEIEYGVEATIQPVASLTKHEVREVLKFFKVPNELVYRKAFPGPALAARIIGPVTEENLAFEKKVHDLVESYIDDYYANKFGRLMIVNNEGDQEPFQAFTAVSEDVLNRKVTGIVEGKRTYELPLSVRGEWDFYKLTTTASQIKGYSRLLYTLATQQNGKYDVLVRSVNSKDARTARVTSLPYELLKKLKRKLKQFPETKDIYFDITPKPPATIEYV